MKPLIAFLICWPAVALLLFGLDGLIGGLFGSLIGGLILFLGLQAGRR